MTDATPIARRPVVLVVLDGWGEEEATKYNAIKKAAPPVWAKLTRDYPNGFIEASEEAVGLPHGQMGNSEVGHMNIGAGRVVVPDLPRIDEAIEKGDLAKNPQLRAFIDKLKKSGGDCHLMGLLSDGGVHAHQDHIAALANIIAKQGIHVWIHAFLDGRDTPPESALGYIKGFNKKIENHELVKFASASGRFYGMDRDNNWGRIKDAYNAIAEGKGLFASSIEKAVEKSYAQGVLDEEVIPSVMQGYKGIKNGDGVLMANFRADRAREITSALCDPNFDKFERPAITLAAAAGMTEYSEGHNKFLQKLFEPQKLPNLLGEVVAEKGLKQFRVAETEKYAHVTFFFNGGREEPFEGEDRKLIPSPKVTNYAELPAMSAAGVTNALLEAINSNKYDFIVVNYANTDMVGHTGNMFAAETAVTTVDGCLGQVLKAVEDKGGAMVITADHGNAEKMFDEETDQPHTAHTVNKVPVVLVSPELKGRKLDIPKGQGKLADIAPTVLQLMGIEKPKEMSGTSLCEAVKQGGHSLT